MRKKAPRPDRSTEGVSAGVSFPQDLKNWLPSDLLAEVGAVRLLVTTTLNWARYFADFATVFRRLFSFEDRQVQMI